jgi:dTDP-4-amino-4,6-dideoxygalactose transaminase
LKVKFLDLKAQYESIKDEVESAVKRVLESGGYILGENVSLLEAETAAYCGAKHCAGVASGTDALVLALRACGVSPGDSVITTPFTFTASVEAILRCGAEPVLCDIEPDTFNIDAGKIGERVKGNTKAVLPVHLYGHPADMDAVMRLAAERGLKVVEDAAQAFGAEYKGRKAGTLGDAGAFSFFPSKTLGACGDAGMIASGDEKIHERLKLLRAHGLKDGECVESGYNSRLDEIQAAILRVKLRHVDDWLLRRKIAAELYNELLQKAPVATPSARDYAKHSFNYYVIKCEKRNELRKYLFQNGVETGVYYPAPAHLQKAFRSLGSGEGDFPVAEEAARRVLALPIYPDIDRAQQVYVADMIKYFYTGGGKG